MNTSGFGTRDNPPVVAIFTYHQVEGERAGRIDFQTQGIAFSTDKGRTWTKYDGNPVIFSPGIKDFRDPKVFWESAQNQWVMTLAVKDHVEFYVSKDLKEWKKSGEFGKEDGSHGGVWECPDLFLLRTADGVEKYVLLVSINPGAPNRGSGTQYFLGNFDGATFINDTPGENSGWVDWGTDNYAGVSFSGIPREDGRTITMGWMSNWLYAQVVPTETWRSAMTVPRTLSLMEMNNKLVLSSAPVHELAVLRDSTITVPQFLQADDSVSTTATFPAGKIELIAEVDKVSVDKDFEWVFTNDHNDVLIIGHHGDTHELYIDRTRSGDVSFSQDFPGIHTAKRISRDTNIRFTILLDVSSVEIFIDQGTLVMTDLVFPESPYTTVQVFSGTRGVAIDTLQINTLKSIWSAE
jgi:fructan beta-fructosidase